MKEYLFELARESLSPLEARNHVREYLQVRILSSMQHAGVFIPLAFQGGTALRFLYSLRRYSEDLDFTLERDTSLYDLKDVLATIRSDLLREAYDIEITYSEKRVVHSAFISFPGLLSQAGLSRHPAQSFSVKIEVDTRPPAGAVLETSVIRRHVLLQVQHRDKASLLAGKIHAILNRSYLKGRDVYDLFWYLSDPAWPQPNFELLNNALRQTGWKGAALHERNWKRAVQRRLQKLPWKDVVSDVRPFLEEEQEAPILTEENLQRLLTKPVRKPSR